MAECVVSDLFGCSVLFLGQWIEDGCCCIACMSIIGRIEEGGGIKDLISNSVNLSLPSPSRTTFRERVWRSDSTMP